MMGSPTGFIIADEVLEIIPPLAPDDGTREIVETEMPALLEAEAKQSLHTLLRRLCSQMMDPVAKFR